MQSITLLDRYELIDEIGRGGMGVVYRARDPVLDREIAVKMIPRGNMGEENEERFRREARVVAQMDHPAIVSVHDFGHCEGSLFLVMPLLTGQPLRALIREGVLRRDEALDVIAQVAEALAYSHARGIVHRDVKPENIMVSREGDDLRVRVMDFGLAWDVAENRLTQAGGLIGTIAYMSPEQLAGTPIDGRSDLYTLGTVLYECLAGERPFSGRLQALLNRVVNEAPQSLRQRGVDVEAGLDDLVLSCLAKRPDERPDDGKVVARALRSFAQGLENPGAAPPAQAPGPKGGRPLSPMVGREAELAKLEAAFAAALAGECQLVLVEGDLGIGKTRLLSELRYQALERGLLVLRGNFVDQRSTLPYQGFFELIQDYFRIQEIDRRSLAGGRLPDLSDLAADLLALFPLLSEVPELRPAATGAETKEALAKPDMSEREVEPTRLFELLARTLTRVAAGRPAVLLLENLHAGEVSIDALGYLVRRLGSTPMLFIGTCRRTDIGSEHALSRLLRSFQDDPRCHRVALAPLRVEAFRRLVEIRIDSTEVHDELIERLYEATGGNPFFAQELVNSLLDSGVIRRDEKGRWSLVSPAGFARTMPATIQEAVERRLGRLPDPLRAVLAVASVLGRSFDERDLKGLLDQGVDLDEALDALIEEGILEEDGPSGSDRLHFNSGVVCDVLYRKLPRRKRRNLHRRHALRLEERHKGRPERALPQLFHHFSAGCVADKMVLYGLDLARRALASWSPEEAIRHARTAFELVDEAGVEEASRVSGEILLVIARAQRIAGRFEPALTEAQRAITALVDAGAPQRAATAALFLAETAWQGRQVDEVLSWVERGLDLTRGSAGPRRELLILGATVANLRGEYPRAKSYLEEAEELAPKQRDQQTPEGGCLVSALPNPVTTLDPPQLLTDEETEVASNLYDTLLTTSENGGLGPGLCEEWTASNDGRTFELTLRPDVHFSDGRVLSAEDVKRSLRRAMKRGTALRRFFSVLEGFDDLVRGKRADLPGIEVQGTRRVIFHLRESLPIFPILLTDPQTAVVRQIDTEAGDGSTLLGTGPFFLDRRDTGSIRLLRHPQPWRAPSRLEAIEFRTSVEASVAAAGLRAGEIDLARDLLPADLEDILRDPSLQAGFAETTKMNLYFVVFNPRGPVSRQPQVRRALAGVLRIQDLVWRNLGRFARPAVCLIPPGILGHDPGRRPRRLTASKAAELLHQVSPGGTLSLRAVIHPTVQERCASLQAALLEEWASIGAQVEVAPSSMDGFLDAIQENDDVDLLICRWNANYADPDDFTHGLFHSQRGLLRCYSSSDEGDSLLEQARQESRPAERQALYKSFEDLLDREHLYIPLFHDVNYRIAGPQVHGLRLSNHRPYVNYESLGKQTDPGDSAAIRPPHGGEIHVSMQSAVDTLDPTVGMFADYHEAIGSVFETLTRVDDGAHIVPWLAAAFEARSGGRIFHFRLRPDLHFQDGRRLTARDVRYSLERVLRTPRSGIHFFLLPIRGAQALRDGEAQDLAGLRIFSADEFELELEQPLAQFPALLTHPVTSIVPEGCDLFTGRWRDGCAGTGPYRVVRFDRGRELDLEKNPQYWRPGFPKNERLVFHFGVSPERAFEELRRGRLTLASELRPEDEELLHRDPELFGYQESPRLATYYLALNTQRQPLSDRGLRRILFQVVGEATRQAATPRMHLAHGLIPPGLLGHEPTPLTSELRGEPDLLRGRRLEAVVNPLFNAQYAPLWDGIREMLDIAGLTIESVERSRETTPRIIGGTTDVVVDRWIADYPDTAGFVGGLLRSGEGVLAHLCGTPEIDRLIDAGRLEGDPALRHAIYREIDEMIVSEALLIPLFHEQNYRFHLPTVEGLRFSLGPPEVRYEELHAKR